MNNEDKHQPSKVNETDKPVNGFFANMIDQENTLLGLPLKTVTKRTWGKESNSTINLPVKEQEQDSQDLQDSLIMETTDAVKNKKTEVKNNGLYNSISSEDQSKFFDFSVSEKSISNKEEEDYGKNLGIIKEFQTKLGRAKEERIEEEEKSKRATISLDFDKVIPHSKKDSIGKNQSDQIDKTSPKTRLSLSSSALSEYEADNVSSIPHENTSKSNFVSKEQASEEGVREKQEEGEEEEKDNVPPYITHEKIVSDDDLIKTKEQIFYNTNNNTSVSDIDASTEKKQAIKKKIKDFNKQNYLIDTNNNKNNDNMEKKVSTSFDRSSLQEKKKTSEDYETQEVDVAKPIQNKEFFDKTNKNSNTSKYSNSFSYAVLENEKNKNLERDFVELLKVSSYINDVSSVKKTSPPHKKNISQESSNMPTTTTFSIKPKIASESTKSKQKLSNTIANPYQQMKGTFTKKNMDNIDTQNRITRLSIGNINIQISNTDSNKNNLSRRVESTSPNSFFMASDLDIFNKTYQWRLHD